MSTEAHTAHFSQVPTQLLLLDTEHATRHQLIADVAGASALALAHAMQASPEKPDPVWAAWLSGGHMRKSARRAKTKLFASLSTPLSTGSETTTDGDTCQQHGTTWTTHGTAAASAPVLIPEMPGKIRSTQVSGWTVQPETQRAEPDALAPGLHIWLDQALELSTGKACAQAAHAATLAALDYSPALLLPVHIHEVVFEADLTDSGRDWIRIQDAGLTEVAPGATTCMATVVEPSTDQH